MHTTRSPSASVQTGAAGDVLDLSLTGSQLTVGRRPSSASPGKHFSRSISVSVTSDGRGKRNTLVSLAEDYVMIKKMVVSVPCIRPLSDCPISRLYFINELTMQIKG